MQFPPKAIKKEKKQWEGQDQNIDLLLTITNSSFHKMLSTKKDAQNT